jgi:hypothetical protein
MPHIETWSRLPRTLRDHLVERMHDRNISLDHLNQLAYGWRASPKFRKVLGIRTLGRSSFAAMADIQRLFFSPVNLLSGASYSLCSGVLYVAIVNHFAHHVHRVKG